MKFMMPHMIGRDLADEPDKVDSQSGQATIEYILMLSIMVFITVMVMKTLIVPTFDKLNKFVINGVENRLVKMDLHKFPVQR